MAASDCGAPCTSPRVNMRWLQGFSGPQNQQAAAATAPRTHGILPGENRRKTACDDGGRVLGLGVLRVKIRVI
jgi:hypothetical protein